MRAHRLGVNTDNLLIFSENNLSIIEAYLDNINPDLIIVDSIQTVYSPEISSAPGTVSQIKEGTSRFMKISKRIFLSELYIQIHLSDFLEHHQYILQRNNIYYLFQY